MKNYIQVTIHSSSQATKDVLIAELAYNNFYAFEEQADCLIAYTKEENFNIQELESILSKDFFYEIEKINDKNWNADWEQNFQPVFIEKFAGIRASFHKPLHNVLHEVIITPKMSFGTGHHATTFLMIKMMELINFKNKKVLDFGTGTGILAILAEKLGAGSVLATDIDDWSIENASENITANYATKILLKKTDTIKGLSYVDIILANINLNVLIDNVKTMSGLMKPLSLLLISGILISDELLTKEKFESNSLIKKQSIQKDGWLAILFQKH